MYNQGKLHALRVLGFRKEAEEFGAHIGQLLFPGIGTAIGGYAGEGSDDTKLRRAVTSAGGGIAGLIPGAALGVAGIDHTIASLAARAGGHLGTHLGYQYGNKPSK